MSIISLGTKFGENVFAYTKSMSDPMYMSIASKQANIFYIYWYLYTHIPHHDHGFNGRHHALYIITI